MQIWLGRCLQGVRSWLPWKPSARRAPWPSDNSHLLTDNLNTYTWDPNWGNMLTVSTNSATVTALYDAMGRMVENNAGGSYSEFIYGPGGGKLAKVNGQALINAFISLPGGGKAIYNSSGVLYHFRHSDWLGSSRITSTGTQTLYSSTAYAPFGEQYKTSGSADASYTGQDQDTVSSLYDFPARRQSSSQGRWISPDPAGRSAVSLTNPQNWNRYAYAVNNPLALIDATGMSVKRRRPHGMDDLNSCGDDDGDCNDDDDGGGSDDDNNGDDNGDCQGDACVTDPDPTQNCDDQCQANQALQNALMAVLTNTNCAALIGGPSAAGQAAAAGAIAGQLFGNPNSNISFSAEPDPGISGFAETDLVQYPTPGVTMGLGSGFYDPGYTAQNGLSSLSFAQNQTVTILHEYGHAMGDLYAMSNNGQYGYDVTTNIMWPDSPLTNPGVSNQNDQNVAGACLQGGNVPTQTSDVSGTIQ
jgi:RHS repeat-associated protein